MIELKSLGKIKDICKTPCGQRQGSDIKCLVELTKEIKLFRELIAKQGEAYHAACCQYLFYESFEEREYIFRHGDIGNKFYIILQGVVGIEIPITDSGHRTFTEIMTYTSGSSFGELALESSKPRSASAFCKDFTHCLVLLKADYSRLMQRIVTEKKNEMTYFLQSLPIFQKVNKLALAKLTYNVREKVFTKGQFLFIEGEPAKEIFIVHDGECKLSKKVERHTKSLGGIRKINRSCVHTAKKLGKGAMIGEEDILKKLPHSYSCICCSNIVTVYSIPAVEFFIRITADQPLQYLKNISEEKVRFLES